MVPKKRPVKNIILIHPRVGSWDWMRTNPALPLNLLHASSCLAQEYEVKIIDQRIEWNWKNKLVREINNNTLFAGVTFYTGPMILEALKISEVVRKYSGLPVVWGGIHPSIHPDETIKDDRVDIIVRREGEVTLAELARALDRGKSLKDVKGITFKDDSKTINNPDRELLDLDLLPDIPLDLVEIRKYLPLYKGRSSIYFQASRGCPNRCAYCYNTVYNGNKWRNVSAEKVLERIDLRIKKYDVRDIYFVDDNFFIDLKWAGEIMAGLRKRRIQWQCQGVDWESLARMDDEYLRLLKESGCARVSMGVETASAKIRKIINKNGTFQDVEKQIERLNRLGIVIFCSFMTGFPGENEQDFKENILFISKIVEKYENVRVSPIYGFNPYPGTSLYKEISKNYPVPQSLEDWGKKSGYDVYRNYTEDVIIRKNGAKIYFLSNLIDQKVKEYNVPWLIKFLSSLYLPWARKRFRNQNYSFLFEYYLARLASGLWHAIKMLSTFINILIPKNDKV